MFRLVKAERTRDCDVHIWARDEFGNKLLFPVSFEPYFYIPLDEPVPEDAAITRIEFGSQSVFGEDIKKVFVVNPSEVPRLREKFSRGWEADVPYGRRFLVSKGITSYFDEHLQPVVPPGEAIPFKVWAFDIETFAHATMPEPTKDSVTCWSVSDGEYGVSAILDDANFMAEEGNWAYLHFSDEKMLLSVLEQFIAEQGVDCLVGWNVSWDKEYIEDRCKALDMRFRWEGCTHFDLLASYRALYRRRSYRLKDIAIDEGLTDVVEEKVDYGKMWEEDKPGLLARNRRHTEWVAQIDKKLRITEYHTELKELAGLENFDDTQHSSVLIDTMLLRRAKGALPSKQKREHELYEGALVLTPPAGVFRKVVFYDLSRFYPSIILSEKLDFLILHSFIKQNNGELDWAKYAEFAEGYQGETLLLGLVSELIAQRAKFQQAGHKDKLAAVKGLLNSAYGVLAYPGFRMYMPEIPARVTEVARKIISSLAEEAKGFGLNIIYADTDSLCVGNVEDIKGIEERLNQALKKYGDYTIKTDKAFKTCLFLGLKKKYCGLSEDGKLEVTGFERIRTDSSNYTRQVQEQVMRLILEGRDAEIIPYLKQVMEGIKSARLEDIAITKGLSKDLTKYEKSPQNYILAAKTAGMTLAEGDSIRMVPALNYPHGMAVFRDLSDLKKEVKVDWAAVIDKQVRAKVGDLLELCGRSWSETTGQGRLL